MNAVVAMARDYVRLLFSFHGWIGRANFVRGMVLVWLLNLVILGSIAIRLPTLDLGPLGALLTLPIATSLATKRLHAINRSGWWQAPVRGLVVIGLFGLANAAHGGLSAATGMVLLAALIVGVLADIGLFGWLALTPNRLLAEDPVEAFD